MSHHDAGDGFHKFSSAALASCHELERPRHQGSSSSSNTKSAYNRLLIVLKQQLVKAMSKKAYLANHFNADELKQSI
jgi:hypothetical protein